MASNATIIIDVKRDTRTRIGDYVVQRLTASFKGRILKRYYIVKREDKS